MVKLNLEIFQIKIQWGRKMGIYVTSFPVCILSNSEYWSQKVSKVVSSIPWIRCLCYKLERLKSSLSFSPNTSKVKNCYALAPLFLPLSHILSETCQNMQQSDLIHYQTENGRRHARGPVHQPIPTVTFMSCGTFSATCKN